MKSAKENWITIKQNNNYEVSNFGNVRNKKTKRILKPSISNKGYYLVALSNKGKSHTYTIHKLVMEHFNRCAFDYEVINHIDHNKLNNNINNLEYITQRENVIKAVEHGKIKVKSVEQYDKNNNFIQLFKSISEAHRKTNVAISDIHRCCNNERKMAGGYIWKYGGRNNA